MNSARLILIGIGLLWLVHCGYPVDPEDTNESWIPNLDQPNQIEIMTWNIEQFPKAGTRTVDTVAAILTQLQADIYCLQEMKVTSSLQQLALKLPDYDYVLSQATKNLHLAILYKTKKLSVRSTKELFQSNYWEFASRPPLRVDFTLDSTEAFNFSVINLHLKCCGSATDLERRRLSAEILHDYLNTELTANSDSNFVVVGDWNDDITDPESLNSFLVFLNDTNNYHYVTYELATSDNDYYDSYPSWPSFIDHILITRSLFDEETSSVVETIRLDDYISNYHDDISDHRPVVWMFTP